MHFGYLNRNYLEELHIPIGQDNRIEPGGPDRGQPTHFYTRINRNLFSVRVPKGWGVKDEVVWTVTVRGTEQKAIAWLQPEWEIDPLGGASIGGRTDQERKINKPPTLALDPPPATITLPSTLTLTATASDDGIPKPREQAARRAVGQETPPTLQPPPGTPEAPVNVPALAGDVSDRGRQGPQGLRVSWIVWRGPAGVTFEPRTALVKDAKAVVTATFTTPGDYVLQARASDGMMSTVQELAVTVVEGH